MVLWEIEDKAIGIRTGLNQCNFDDAVQSSQATPTGGGGVDSDGFLSPFIGQLPVSRSPSIINSGSRGFRSSKPAAAGTRPRPSSRAPSHSHSPRPQAYKGILHSHPEGPRPETRAKAAGKVTFHLSSYFSSPNLTPANESTKTEGGRDLALATPCRLDRIGPGGGPCEGRCPYRVGGSRGGLRLRPGSATRARWEERACTFFTSPGSPSPARCLALLTFHLPVAESRCRCGVGVRFSGRHGWLRICEPGAAGRL